MGVTGAEASDALDSLAASLRKGVEGLDDSLTVGWASGQIADTVLSRVDRLESGEPLGGPAERRDEKVRRNLDQATASRSRRRR